MFEADLREGVLAAADPKVGFRRIEAGGPRVGDAQGAKLVGANLERSKLSGVIAVRADFTDAILKDARLVRANLKQATMKGCNLSGADLSGADLAGADLRDAVLVGAKTLQWNVSNANMSGALTDKPAGIAAASLPYKTMIQDHARWCETGGLHGAPSVFDGADFLRAWRPYAATTSPPSPPRARSSTAWIWRACSFRAPISKARTCVTATCGAPTFAAPSSPTPSSPVPTCARPRWGPCCWAPTGCWPATYAAPNSREPTSPAPIVPCHAMFIDADVSRANFTGVALLERRKANFTGVARHGARGLDETI